MNADDAAALYELETKLQKPSSMPAVVPWLVRVVKELDARVQELEQGGIPAVIAKKDAAIASRDAEMAKLGAQVAKFEKDHLPDPREYYRDLDKQVVPGATKNDSSNIVADNDPSIQSDELKHPHATK
jgi:hypothetical protein